MRMMFLTGAIVGGPVMLNPLQVSYIYEGEEYEDTAHDGIKYGTEYHTVARTRCSKVRLSNGTEIAVKEPIGVITHEWKYCMAPSENEDADGEIVKRIIERAEKNMVPSEVKDIKRILASIKLGKRYSDVTEEELKDL